MAVITASMAGNVWKLLVGKGEAVKAGESNDTANTCAIKTVATACMIAVPSILIVAPSGTTKEVTGLDTPRSCSVTFIAVGNVALLLDVLNATAITGKYFLKC